MNEILVQHLQRPTRMKKGELTITCPICRRKALASGFNEINTTFFVKCFSLDCRHLRAEMLQEQEVIFEAWKIEDKARRARELAAKRRVKKKRRRGERLF